MIVLMSVSLASLIVYFSLYLSRHESRYLYFFCAGWLINGLAALLYWIMFSVSGAVGRIVGGGFSAAQLVGPALLILGVFSYFRAFDAKRLATRLILAGVGLMVVYALVPSIGALTIVLENLLLFGAVAYGLMHPARFKQVGGWSYYWLIAISVVGSLAAAYWLRFAGVPVTEPIVMPWLGTTATIICVAFFCLSLEHSDATRRILERERELGEYRDHLESLVQERTRDLVLANHAKSEFLSAMSHELRTPLNSVIGFSGILQQQPDGALTTEQRRQVQMISAAGRHLLELVEEVLEFSQADGGQLIVQPQQFEVAPLVESVVESMRMSAEKTGVSVDLEIGSECETMCSDPTRVQQLLRSIIGNAVKFTGSGAVSVQVICTEPNLLVFEVRDTGIGMTAEELSCVFDDFYQAPRPDGAKHPGAGLGLAVSRRIAEMLGGRIEAESTPGVGSVFRLFLPRHCP